MLRGINVSGQKLIKMPELKLLYESLGFSGVVTYIQSGNVIFKTGWVAPGKDLSLKIESAIQAEFGFEVSVIIRSIDEMKKIVRINPFQDENGLVPDKIYVTFLENEPLAERIEKISPFNFLPDKYKILGKEIYLSCSSGYGTTKLSNTFFENRLKTRATTRNWNTINKLIELASSCRQKTIDFRPPTANYELQTANCELRTANCELRTANCELPTLKHLQYLLLLSPELIRISGFFTIDGIIERDHG